MIDEDQMAGNAVAPPVHIEAIVAAFGRATRCRKGFGFLRGPSTWRLTTTALSFVVPQRVIFRYMLEGHDAGWQEPARGRQAFYNDLRPALIASA